MITFVVTSSCKWKSETLIIYDTCSCDVVWDIQHVQKAWMVKKYVTHCVFLLDVLGGWVGVGGMLTFACTPRMLLGYVFTPYMPRGC